MKKTTTRLLFSTVALLALAACTPTGDNTPKDKTIHLESISLNEHSKTLNKDETLSLNVTFNPDNATNQNVTWSVDHSDYVSLSATSGASITVTAFAAGTAVVTATSEDGNKTDSCTITVQDNQPITQYVKAYIHDEKGLLQSVEQKVNNEFAAVTDTGLENEVPYYNLILNAQTRVKLQEVGYFAPTGIDINNEVVSVDNDGYVIFNANPGDYDFLSLTIKYKDSTPVTGEYTLTVQNTSHVEVVAYSDEECTNHVASADPGTTIYLKATPSSDRYFVRNITIKRVTSDTGHIDTSKANSLGDNKFSFEVPYAHNKVITIIPEEGDNSLLQECKAVGTYLTIWLTASYGNVGDDVQLNRNVVINGDGSIVKYKADKTEDFKVQVKSFTDSTLYTEDYATLYYGEYYFLGGDPASGGKFSTPFDSYNFFCIRKKNATDLDSEYEVVGEKFLLGTSSYYIIQVAHNSTPYVNFLINQTASTVYENVDIEMLNGSRPARRTYTRYAPWISAAWCITRTGTRAIPACVPRVIRSWPETGSTSASGWPCATPPTAVRRASRPRRGRSRRVPAPAVCPSSAFSSAILLHTLRTTPT